MKQKPCVVLGICGGIAAYKMAGLASRLTKKGIDVQVLMTRNATEFITPLTMETLTGNACVVDTFDRNFKWDVQHISLAKRADAVLIAPATANVAAKLAHGLADDMLTTTVLAMTCPKIISPAMNTAMYENPITKRNFATLREFGFTVIEAESGHLACRDDGKGRLPKEEVLEEYLLRALCEKKDLAGKRVLVTAGATREALDPVRFLTNHSTGKMGYAVAQAAWQRGATVTLVSGKTNLPAPQGVELVSVESAAEMWEAVQKRADAQDIIVKAAAVADFTPTNTAAEKIKKGDAEESTLTLKRTSDILAQLGKQKREGQLLCGFSMETEHLLEHSEAKRKKKNADLIVANSLREEQAGFAGDTNKVTLLTEGEAIPLPVLSKLETAHRILDRLVAFWESQEVPS